MSKKLLGILLSLVLAVSMLTASALAAEGPVAEVDTAEKLVEAIAVGGEIKLTDDITVDKAINVQDGTIINLNGKTLYINVENSYYNDVTIKNGSIVLGKDDVHVCDGYFLVNAGKTLVLNGVDLSSAEGGIKGYAVFHLKTGANLDLIESTVNINGNEHSAGYIVYAGESTATLDVVNSTVTGVGTNGVVHATTVIDGSTVTITDPQEHGINRSAVTIDDSNVTISGGTGRGITAQHGDLVITGNSEVKITDMDEATIELRNDKNLIIAETATVIVDVAVNNTTSGTITGTVSFPTVAVIGETPFTSLQAAIDAAENGDVIVLVDGEHNFGSIKIPGGSNITIKGSANAVLMGQIASTSSTAGTLTLEGVTVKVDSNIKDTTGISQTSKSAIAIWGNQKVVCRDVTFDMSLAESSAISGWWDTKEGTTIECYNCVFNCAGQRPIRSCGNVTIEGCTFNDPYRYAVQLTGKAGTATELSVAVINFKNNTINAGTTSSKTVVYGIQLEGEDYGCNDLIINGSGNVINVGTTGKTGTMYYCECGKVDHNTIFWNVEETPVHEGELCAAIETDEGVRFFGSLQAAIDAAKGGEVKLLKDIELTETVTIEKAVTLDLNGKTISQTKEQSAAYSMIDNKGDLTIIDSVGGGKISYTDSGTTAPCNYVSNTVANSGKLTVAGGTIENLSGDTVASNGYPHAIDTSGALYITGGTVSNDEYSAIRIWCTTDDDTYVEITGGTVHGAIDLHNVNGSANKGVLIVSDKAVLECNEANSAAIRFLAFGADVDEFSATITGGTITGKIIIRNYCGAADSTFDGIYTISGGTFAYAPDAAYVAEGYSVVEDGDMYKVVYTGMKQDEDGVWKYFVNGEVAVDYTGLVLYNGSWFYVAEGLVDWDYTGLADFNGEQFYVSGGQIDWEFTGLVSFMDELYYITAGYVDNEFTGLAAYEDAMLYVVDGQVQFDFTGIVAYDDALFYVVGGAVATDFTGMVSYNDTLVYVAEGQVVADYTGLVLYNDLWYYVADGQLDADYTGMVQFNGVWFYVTDGQVNWDYAGLVEVNGELVYVSGGQIDWGFSGLVSYDGELVYVSEGMVDWNYTGLVLYNDVWVYVADGQLDADYTGMIQFNGTWFYISGGEIDWDYEGLVFFNDALVYISNGEIDWSFSGLVYNDDELVYVSEGMVDWSYTGLVNYEGDLVYISGGVADWNYTGLALYNDAWVYMADGELDMDYTGLVLYNGTWFYVADGEVDWDYEGMTLFNGTWFYVSGGEVDWDYEGMTLFNGTWFYISGGMVDWNYNGLTLFNGVWFYIDGGMVDWGFSGTFDGKVVEGGIVVG